LFDNPIKIMRVKLLFVKYKTRFCNPIKIIRVELLFVKYKFNLSFGNPIKRNYKSRIMILKIDN